MKKTNPRRIDPVEFEKNRILKEFQTIPGVGKSICMDLWDLGYRRISELRNGDPEQMYVKLMEIRGSHIDRCVLYVFRCAVYYSSSKNPNPERLLWWNWKD